MIRCDRCGSPARSRVFHEGAFYCPACHEATKGWRSDTAHAIARDEIPGGMWVENYGPDPIKVYSHSERKRLLKRVQYDKTTGRPYVLTEKENFAPLPGTDRDAQGIPNPNGYRSLAAAAILARNGRTDESLGGGVSCDQADPDDIANSPQYRDARVRHFNFDTDTEGAREFLRVVMQDGE